MCGIIAGFNTQPKKGKQKTEKINDFIINQYQDQCNRGTKGFGIIRITENGKIELDRATQELKFMLDLYQKPAKMIIAHHRQPTSSENKMNQTHPIFISNKILKYDYLFVHNGVISNDIFLKNKHEKLGFKYSTEYLKEGYYETSPTVIKFNDSEALGTEIALLIEEKITTVETDNTAAFITLQIDKKTNKASKVFFGRSGISSCLNLSISKGTLLLSSEGEGEPVVSDTLWSFDPKDPKMKLTSKGMTFKKPEEPAKESPYAGRHIHQNPLPVPATNDTTMPQTESKSELVRTKKRNWNENNIDESNTDIEYEEELEEIFVGKGYQEEMVQEFKESIKDDDSEMIETSLETALDDQTERVGKIMANFQKTVIERTIDRKERSFFLSQTYKILETMEKIAEIAEEEYNQKLTQEELKKQEEELPEQMDTGNRVYQAKKRIYNHKTRQMEEVEEDYMGFNRFG